MEGWKPWSVSILLGTAGMGLIVYGLWEEIKPREVVVEIVQETERVEDSQVHSLVVDVSGAVEKPGIYKLPVGSRIGDALVVAHGLAQEADREWVATTLNLAANLEDGEKIYIPKKEEQLVGKVPQLSNEVETRKIDINKASIGELDSLEGIGEARANSIIANRPYSKPEEIVAKAKIPTAIYDKIKDSIRVY